MRIDTKKYELWHSVDECGYTFFESNNEAVRKMLAADAILVWEVEATSLIEAQSLKHKHLGWEPYIPPADLEVGDP